MHQKVKEVNVLPDPLVLSNETVSYLSHDLYFHPPIIYSHNIQSDHFQVCIRPCCPTHKPLMTGSHYILNKTSSAYHWPIRPVSSGPWSASWPYLSPSFLLSHPTFLLFFEHTKYTLSSRPNKPFQIQQIKYSMPNSSWFSDNFFLV